METKDTKDLRIEELEKEIETLTNKLERLKEETLRIKTERDLYSAMIKGVTEYY